MFLLVANYIVIGLGLLGTLAPHMGRAIALHGKPMGS
jgi:hypothetical protein